MKWFRRLMEWVYASKKEDEFTTTGSLANPRIGVMIFVLGVLIALIIFGVIWLDNYAHYNW